MSLYYRQKERGEDNKDWQYLKSQRHLVRRETSMKVELTESHSVGWNCPRGRFQLTKQLVEHKVSSAAECCLP